ncbi:MAG: zinc-ribbon domain-containing protein [Myxococcales bacterium]|nr:zinc-ribbon domain-containing protein [Myxococcales bacterium]
MRFICDNCHAKYSIAEHKVRNKVLKIRCKRCSYVIVVRDPEAKKESDLPVAAAPSSAVIPSMSSAGLQSMVPSSSFQMRSDFAAPTAPKNPSSVTFASVERTQQKQPVAAPQNLSVHEPEQRSERTMVARISADWFRQIREEKNEQPTWFYAVHNSPVGPVTLSDLQTAVIRCEVLEESLIWNAGWPNWRPAKEASELHNVFVKARGGIAEPAPIPEDPEINNALAGIFEPSSPYKTMDESITRGSVDVDTDRDLYDDSSDEEGATSIQSIAAILQQGREAGEDVSALSAQLNEPEPQPVSFLSPEPARPEPAKPSFPSPLASLTPAARPEPTLEEPAPPKPFAPFSPSSALTPKEAPKGPSPLDWLNHAEPAAVEEPKPAPAPFGAFAKAEPKVEDNNPFGGLMGGRPRTNGASNGAMNTQSVQQESEKKAEMPFPAPVVERPAPAAPAAPIKNQDIAMESQALPASMGDLIESSEEAMFFDRSYKESGTGNEIFEVELPPLPVVLEEPADEMELSIDDDDILEELSETIKPRTGRNVLLAGAGLVIVLILLSSVIVNKQIEKNFEKRDKNIQKLINIPSKQLTDAQRKLQEELLRGSGRRELPPAAAKKAKKRYRRGPRRAVARLEPTATARVTKKATIDADILGRLARRGVSFNPGKASGSGAPKVTLASGVDTSLAKKILKEIEANKGQVAFCYEQYLKNLTVSGRLGVSLEIDSSGSVLNADPGSSRLGRSQLGRCIVRSMKRWRFTPFTGSSITIEVPYILKAQY